MAVLGLHFCARAFSSCGKQGPLLIAVCGPPTIVASPAAEHSLQTRRLSNCGPRAQLLRGMWDPPRPGLEPVSPALAGRFSTTAPPGKPQEQFYVQLYGGKMSWVVLCPSHHVTSGGPLLAKLILIHGFGCWEDISFWATRSSQYLQSRITF